MINSHRSRTMHARYLPGDFGWRRFGPSPYALLVLLGPILRPSKASAARNVACSRLLKY